MVKEKFSAVKAVAAIAALAALLLLPQACKSDEQLAPPIHRVNLVYAAAFSSLSSYISEDMQDLCEGMLPSLASGDVLLVYQHFPIQYGFYKIPTSPILFRAWRNADGTVVRDTLITYPPVLENSTPEVLRGVLTDAKNLYPAPHYGVTFSSHGQGWIPAGYEENSNIDWALAPQADPTKQFLIEHSTDSGINLDEFADAIPYKLDYIIMDACLMGCVEVAHQLREKCDWLLFSPTEVISDGLAYKTLAPLLTNVPQADMVGVARQYFEQYNSRTDRSRAATVSVVNCKNVDALAAVCATLIDNHRSAIENINHSAVQAYFYNDFHWYYDLRDIFSVAGATEAELADLDAALTAAVPYHAETPQFFNLKLERTCGLSMYLPLKAWTELNDYYKTLSWNKAVELVL